MQATAWTVPPVLGALDKAGASECVEAIREAVKGKT